MVWQMLRLKGAAIAALVMMNTLNPAPALADYSSPEHLDKWKVLKVGACQAVLNLGAFRLDESGLKEEGGWDIKKTEWTGACDANGLISGPGSIRHYVWIKDGNRYFTNYYQEYRGKAVNGMLDGTFVGISANYNEDSGRYEAVNWDIDPDFGPPKFVGGCLRDEFEEVGCNPAVGEATRQKYLVSIGRAGPVKTAPAPAAASAPLPSPTPPLAPRPVPRPAPPQPAPQNSPATFTAMSAGLSSASREKGYNAVSGALLAALTGDPSTIGTGSALLDRIVTSLTMSLRSGDGASLLGENDALLDILLGEVRGSLGTNLPTNTNQLVDLALGELKRALAKPRPRSEIAASVSVQQPQRAVGAAVAPTSAIALDPNSVAAVLGRAGFPLKTATANDGTTYLDGEYFTIWFYACTSGSSCKRVQFNACYSYPNANMEKANRWNQEKVIGRASMLTNGSLCVDHLFLTNDGTASTADLEAAQTAHKIVRDEAPEYFNKP